ncbi:MAG: helix-turn-helix transcriptional regulator, partial [Trebonia sp.]
ATLLARVRREAGLSQDELARRAGTSRPTLSAYENGRKSPTLETVQRLLREAGYDLDATRRITFHEVAAGRGRAYQVPDGLPRLGLPHAMATVVLPLTLNWSQPGRAFRLADRSQRARAYEIVLREGGPADILAYVDGALLADLWSDLVLPRRLCAAWAPLMGNVPAAAA